MSVRLLAFKAGKCPLASNSTRLLFVLKVLPFTVTLVLSLSSPKTPAEILDASVVSTFFTLVKPVNSGVAIVVGKGS